MYNVARILTSELFCGQSATHSNGYAGVSRLDKMVSTAVCDSSWRSRCRRMATIISYLIIATVLSLTQVSYTHDASSGQARQRSPPQGREEEGPFQSKACWVSGNEDWFSSLRNNLKLVRTSGCNYRFISFSIVFNSRCLRLLRLYDTTSPLHSA